MMLEGLMQKIHFPDSIRFDSPLKNTDCLIEFQTPIILKSISKNCKK